MTNRPDEKKKEVFRRDFIRNTAMGIGATATVCGPEALSCYVQYPGRPEA